MAEPDRSTGMNAHSNKDGLIATAAGMVPASVAAVAQVQISTPVASDRKNSEKNAVWSGKFKNLLAHVVPPAIVLIALLIVWELACSGPTSALPSPLRIWSEAN